MTRILERSIAFQAAVLGGSAGESAPVDPLAALSDDWLGGSADVATRGWGVTKPAALAGAVVDTVGGTMTLSIVAGSTGATGSFWFNNADGVHLWKEVDGDCQCTAEWTVQNAAGSGVPPSSSYRLVGIAAHDPASVSLNRNYEHAALGVVNGVPQCREWKDTHASTSLFGGDSIGTWHAWIRVTRVGQLFTMSSSLDGVSFSDFHTRNRSTNGPAMPDVMRWGPMCYAVLASHDIRGVCHGVTFATP